METTKVGESKEKEGFLVQFHWPEDNALRALVLTSRAGAQRSRADPCAKKDNRLSSYPPLRK